MYLFVYGTLKQGFGNHRWYLNRPPLLKATLNGWEMASLGGFPAISPSEKEEQKVQGEIYEITPNDLTALDRLEGYPHMYKRKKVTASIGS